MDVVKHTVGIMDPFGLSFRFAFEQLLADYDPEIRYGSRIHTVRTVRETNHAYDACAVRSDYDALINRGDQWHPHHTSHSMITARRVYLLNDMASFQAVNKNTAYAQMHEDHNSCEALIGRTDNVIYPIDFANVSPDSKVISLHFFFPEILKSMIRWLIFVVVTQRRKPCSYSYLWDQFYAMRDRSREQHWSYTETLTRYEEIADRHFQTEEFNDFVAKHLPDFEERAYRWFAGPAFDRILESEVNWVFKIPHERPRKLAHYRGLHQFWLHCERDRLGLRA